ncbi:hypothetical protein ACLB2K_027282 [Fragaria x ananassa]
MVSGSGQSMWGVGSLYNGGNLKAVTCGGKEERLVPSVVAEPNCGQEYNPSSSLLAFSFRKTRRRAAEPGTGMAIAITKLKEQSTLQSPKEWMRIKIAIGAAKDLAFLHSDEAKVIHGNFKSSKILLDSNYNAKLYGHGVSGEQLLDSYRHALHDALILDYESPWYVPPVWEYVAPEVKNTGIGTFISHCPAILYVC